MLRPVGIRAKRYERMHPPCGDDVRHLPEGRQNGKDGAAPGRP